MMRHYALLRMLLAAFLLYFAWSFIPEAHAQIEKVFWGVWLCLFLLVFGSNLATFLQLTSPPSMEQDTTRVRQAHND